MAKDLAKIKRLAEWNRLKGNLHEFGRIPAIKEGEVWWAALGENIGIEINGKSDVYSRPVLIFKKFSRHGFMGIPLTSQPHGGLWYTPIILQNKKSMLALPQARCLSAFRLYRKIGTIYDSDLERVREAFRRLYLS